MKLAQQILSENTDHDNIKAALSKLFGDKNIKFESRGGFLHVEVKASEVKDNAHSIERIAHLGRISTVGISKKGDLTFSFVVK